MKRKTIQTERLNTICWLGDDLIDWISGHVFYLATGEIKSLGRYYPFGADAAISSSDNQYTFVYQRLGTKGLLLKNGELVREINRSYYFAESYEYPATFITFNGVTYLVYCPKEYNRIDFENAETGELVTDVPGRAPADTFHSRLESSPHGRYLMTKGWVWHPVDIAEVFNVADCLRNPLLLDKPMLSPDVPVEINSASFINDSLVVIGSSDESFDDDRTDFPTKHIGTWDLSTDRITSKSKVNGEFGNLFAINERYTWDLFKYPKVIDITTGEIVDKDDSVFSGEQNSSIIKEGLPKIAYNRENKQIAIAHNNTLEILSTDFR
jgi:hypothetical protein